MSKMSLCSNEESTEVGSVSPQKDVSASEKLNEDDESVLRCEEEEDEDEEEDVDFNPFLKGAVSPEASSSLSSEVEGIDGEVDDVSGNHGVDSLNVAFEGEMRVGEDSEHGEEEMVMQAGASSEDVSDNELGNFDSGIEHGEEKDNRSSMGPDVNDVTEGQLSNRTDTRTSTIDLDDEGEDAICKRTRARYSLASFTLDELETFLQETDDDDDLQNVDDEEEYRKFLTAVLQGGEGDDQSTKETEIAADDEDEENDADFELELEELLDSDIDENTRDRNTVYEGAGRRPKTRQNRRSSARSKKNLGQTKRSLRPLLPVLPNGPIPTFYTQGMRTSIPGTVSSCLSSTVDDHFKSGFTAHQIGQLHHLIYEHVQLLIQVFSLCVLDNSRQHIASQVQRLICEMLQKRNEVLAWKTVPYPNICFCSSTESPQSHLVGTSPSSLTSDAHAVSSPSSNQILVSSNVSPVWVPSISGPVLSVLDVAPLSLIGRYLNDIDTAVQGNRRRYREAISDICLEKEPLFPLPNFPLYAQANCEGVSGMGSSAVNAVPRSPSQQPKKSLAAAIVERTKKQSVALVPKEIANLAQRFYPLFNPELYPHKPPPAAVTNRVLFTDAEDELLALGVMEYNTDWKAIQQRFLPCKSKHQIFVRQKNRCSSKAPENSIKAVRRMKTSPLTAEEISCIQEGLKAYKYDLMAVWKFVVPHRDPSLLPRQWRTALGTQKSYKLDEAKKEKRRLYDSKRRADKKADRPSWQSSSEKEDCQAEKSCGENNSGDGPMDNAGETYVHEAFLADWRPSTSSGERNPLTGNGLKEPCQPQTGNMHQLVSASKYPQNPLSHMTGTGQFASSATKPCHPILTSSTSESQLRYPTYQAHRTTGAHLVKLAPDLPPVNLPPSVRVVSQSAFKGYIRGASSHVAGAGGSFGAAKENAVSQLSQVGRSGTFISVAARQNNSQYSKESVTNLRPEGSKLFKEKCVQKGGDTGSDLQMHPLLFQPPEDGRLPYYPLNCSTSNSGGSYSFLSGQPQLHLTLSYDPHQENQVEGLVKSLKEKSNIVSRRIDFHPLMQRTENVNSIAVTTCSTAPHSVGSGAKYDQLQHPLHSFRTEVPEAATGTKPSPDEGGTELDLEIHLSSISRKEKDLKSREVNQHNLVKSRTDRCTGTTTVAPSANAPFINHAENSSANRSISGGNTSIIPSKNMSRYDQSVMGDESQPDIEMEQEELSDSAEESEENVEFECEEMADSEGEEDGSSCEQISEMLNKDVTSFTKKKPATVERDDNIYIRRIPSLELGLSNQGMDEASNSSWLSLDTYSADREGSMTTEGLVVRELASPPPSKFCKKVRLRTRANSQKQVVDIAQQLSLGPLALPPVKKPRKRVCRPNLNIGLTVENSSSDN
ncbi:uncharacterized protein LOC126786183 [Argentina anserina]|uniref:uncharacterized protein LOC126786183 n=1 Tax=Argentina anserina TaxID=57926 RepID=UPI0021767ECF|nr:uncharacterized protein LOC126786183 [Potentilla anserina]